MLHRLCPNWIPPPKSPSQMRKLVWGAIKFKLLARQQSCLHSSHYFGCFCLLITGATFNFEEGVNLISSLFKHGRNGVLTRRSNSPGGQVVNKLYFNELRSQTAGALQQLFVHLQINPIKVCRRRLLAGSINNLQRDSQKGKSCK